MHFLQGIEPLLDNLFSFLRRKTDFFVGASPEVIEETVLDTIRKHGAIAAKEKAEKEKKALKEKEEKLRKAKAAEQKKKVKSTIRLRQTRFLSPSLSLWFAHINPTHVPS